jgi:hypothetical protein
MFCCPLAAIQSTTFCRDDIDAVAICKYGEISPIIERVAGDRIKYLGCLPYNPENLLRSKS